MAKQSITAAVKQGRILVSDGAWGTALQARGMQPGECPERWCLERFEDVRDIARGYIDAGADMVGTNSFGGNGLKLAHYGLEDRMAQINEKAARASRQAAGPGHWVIASMGPTGKMLIMEEVTEEELYATFRDQALALERGGADALCIETMSDVQEAAIAIRAAKENTGCEVIATFAFDRTGRGDYRTMMGVTPTQAAREALEAGADIIGTNCGNGMGPMADIVREMRHAAPETPILIHANAGLPTLEGGAYVYLESPEVMAGQAAAVIEAGADILGGCCGTTPGHIRALRQAVDGLQGQRK